MSPYEPEAEPNEGLVRLGKERFFRMLEDLATSIPVSTEPPNANPKARAREIVRVAGLRAGAMSATMALPPGPLGMLTVIQDLMKVWRIQQQMVADIASCFGKSAQLSRQMMVYCLVRHGAAMLVRDVVARVGERIIVKHAGLRVIQQTLRRIGIHVTQRNVGRSARLRLSKALPLPGKGRGRAQRTLPVRQRAQIQAVLHEQARAVTCWLTAHVLNHSPQMGTPDCSPADPA